MLDVFSDPIEVKVGLLSENMLAGCTVTLEGWARKRHVPKVTV